VAVLEALHAIAHVGDLAVDQMALDADRDRGDEPGADHGAVGLVEEPADPAHAGAGIVLVGEGGQTAPADHGCPSRDGGQRA